MTLIKRKLRLRRNSQRLRKNRALGRLGLLALLRASVFITDIKGVGFRVCRQWEMDQLVDAGIPVASLDASLEVQQCRGRALDFDQDIPIV